MAGTVKVIKAKPVLSTRNNEGETKKLRVAAYCRVSTDSEEQISSYESQVKYYKELIQSKAEWSLVKIYADEAITGTKIDKREDFQRMIQAGVDGEIDLIITKSISRFARNTVDTLKYVRLLKENNVAILFEEENINTLTMDGELLLTILSSVAQQEVHNTSEHVKKGLKMKMQRGDLIGFQGCLGYDYDPTTKSIKVNEEEARTVRYIFKRYVEGIGGTIIARELKELGYRTKRGSLRWGLSAVIGIIKNEKYKGDIMMGKTYTVDPISKRRLTNFGESDKYYLENHHEPIVSAEVYDQANAIREKRACPRRGTNQFTNQSRERIVHMYSFSSMLECGFCGHNLSRRVKNGGLHNEGKKIWQCVVSTKGGKELCEHSLAIDEALLEKAYLEALNKLVDKDNTDQFKDFLETVETAIMSESPTKRISEMESLIKDLEKKKDSVLELRIGGVISKEDCEKKYAIINQELEIKKANLDDLKSQKREQLECRNRLKSFKDTILQHETIDVFSREVFETTIEKVIVGGFDEDGKPDSHLLNFVFKSGISNKDYIGKIDQSKIVKLTEFDCDYPHCIFEKTETGGRRKILIPQVRVIVSLNMATGRKK